MVIWKSGSEIWRKWTKVYRHWYQSPPQDMTLKVGKNFRMPTFLVTLMQVGTEFVIYYLLPDKKCVYVETVQHYIRQALIVPTRVTNWRAISFHINLKLQRKVFSEKLQIASVGTCSRGKWPQVLERTTLCAATLLTPEIASYCLTSLVAVNFRADPGSYITICKPRFLLAACLGYLSTLKIETSYDFEIHHGVVFYTNEGKGKYNHQVN